MHDKKSDYYTSAENYRDIDGNMKSFTFIDHSKKTKIPVSSINSEKVDYKEFSNQYRKSLLDIIYKKSASQCPAPFANLQLRNGSMITWDKKKIESMDNDRLRDLVTLIENKEERK